MTSTETPAISLPPNSKNAMLASSGASPGARASPSTGASLSAGASSSINGQQEENLSPPAVPHHTQYEHSILHDLTGAFDMNQTGGSSFPLHNPSPGGLLHHLANTNFSGAGGGLPPMEFPQFPVGTGAVDGGGPPPAFLFPNFAVNGTQLDNDFFADIVRNHFSDINSSNFDSHTQILLVIAFAILIIFGATGNGLVCYVVARNPSMRTPRNIFIINLAISDLSLCLFTQPFNLMKVSMPKWTMGEFMCKFVPMFAGTNVFVSTISITAIALDRFQVIVYPTKDSMRTMGAFIALLSIWVTALLMASPMLIFNVTQSVEPLPGLVLYQVCVENPRLHYEKGAYSIASMIFQYIVPILIVTVAHARICNKLKYRMVNQPRTSTSTSVPHTLNTFQKRKNEREAKRKRKTNMLLVMIATMFSASWMPLNIFNIMADFNGALLQTIDRKGLVFPICHLCVLSSACTNPVIYGWLNDNFRREFEKVLCWPFCQNIRLVCRTQGRRQGATGSGDHGDASVVIYTKANNGVITTLDVDPNPVTKTSNTNIFSSVSNVSAVTG